jgi:hypothetical protein
VEVAVTPRLSPKGALTAGTTEDVADGATGVLVAVQKVREDG